MAHDGLAGERGLASLEGDGCNRAGLLVGNDELVVEDAVDIVKAKHGAAIVVDKEVGGDDDGDGGDGACSNTSKSREW